MQLLDIHSYRWFDILFGVPTVMAAFVNFCDSLRRDFFPYATARGYRYPGRPVGCDYRDRKKHLKFYEGWGGIHLHNESCIFEPPEER